MSRKFQENESISRYDEIITKFTNLAINRFSWEGLPSGITSEILERNLIERGQLAFSCDENIGYIITSCFGTNDINFYGVPTRFRLMSFNGGYNKEKALEDIVLIKNNPLASEDITNLQIYAKRIDDNEMTQDVNTFQQNIPKIVFADEDSKLTAKILIEKIRKFKFVVFAKKSLLGNVSSESLDTSAPFLLDKLQAHKKELTNEVLTDLGINNSNVDKRERLLVDEVNANNDYTQIMVDMAFDLRKQACKEINEKWGLNISVKKREVDEVGDDNIKEND